MAGNNFQVPFQILLKFPVLWHLAREDVFILSPWCLNEAKRKGGPIFSAQPPEGHAGLALFS